MLKSQLFQGDPKLEAAATSNPAHIMQGARGEHVRKIQLALNKLDNAGLDPDSIYGPKTANAVLAYKQKRGIINHSYQNEADNIVGVMTMAELDEELAASDGGEGDDPSTSRCTGGICVDASEDKGGGKAKNNTQPASPATAAAIVKLVPKVRLAITAARFQLTVAGPFVKNGEPLKKPLEPLLAGPRHAILMINNVFSLDQQKDARPGFENIRRVFANMDVALNRSFETAPLIAPVLFVPNTVKSKEDTALAYTTAGGAFKPDSARIKNINVPSNRIHVCNGLLQETEIIQISTLIHELAHYVSGQPLKISHEHGVPKAGDMIKDRTELDKIKPEAKLRSAEHYAFFAMLAGLHRVTSD